MSIDTKDPPDCVSANVVTLKGTANAPASVPASFAEPEAATGDETLGQVAKEQVRQPLQDRKTNDGNIPFRQNVRPDDRKARKHIFVGGLAAGLILAAAGYIYWDYADHFEITDDAFVEARQFSIAPKVAGYITDVIIST